MLRRVLFAPLVMGLASLPVAAWAYDIKPRTSETAFTAKMRPDILGVSIDSTADSARTVLESAFRGRVDTRTDVRQQKFGDTTVSYVAALTFDFPPGPKRTGEIVSTSFSSPASANRAYFIARTLTFAPDQQPSRTEMIKQVMDKYGAPTIVGDQHLYYIYRAGKIVSVGAKYKATAAVDAIDRPLDPRVAIKLNGTDGRGSCVAAVKRAQAKDKTLNAMRDEARDANCDGTLSVQLTPGIALERVGTAQFTLLDFKRIVSAAAIDGDALASEKNEQNPVPQGAAPKL